MSSMLRTAFLASVVGLALTAGPALAATEKFTADLNAAQETPPANSSGTGTADVTYNTTSRLLSWVVTYQGLTGPATAAHFHGPAKPGVAAPVVVPMKGKLTSPIKGSAKITAKQAADLEAGLWYVNIHTAKYPNGEIRGQVLKAAQ